MGRVRGELARRLEAAEDPALRLAAVERERDYRDGYRGVLGFAWLVLATH